jgi:hypothetical protein
MGFDRSDESQVQNCRSQPDRADTKAEIIPATKMLRNGAIGKRLLSRSDMAEPDKAPKTLSSTTP